MSSFSKTPGPSKATKNKVEQRMARMRVAKTDLLEFAAYFATFDYKVDKFHRDLANNLQNFLKACEAGKNPVLILAAPPRAGKSEIVVRAFIPWVLGQHPDWEFILTTNAQPLADDHGSDIRNVLMDSRFNKLFPEAIIDKTRRSRDQVGMVGTKGGFKAVGVNGTVVGRGAHIFVIDDPHKDQADGSNEHATEEIYKWFRSVATNRLAPGGGIIVMATRWSEIDLTGRILESPMGQRAHYIKYSALHKDNDPEGKEERSLVPNRGYSTEYYQLVRKEAMTKEWNSVYQQEPFPDEGVQFKLRDLEAGLVSKLPDNLNYYMTCDPAASEKERNDPWAIVVWGMGEDDILYFADWFHENGDGMVLKYMEKMLYFAEKYKPIMTHIERCHAINVLESGLKRMMRERRVFFRFETPTTGNKDKLARSTSFAAWVEHGKVRWRDCPFVRETVFHEFVAFPDARHDDLVDCASMMGNMIDKAIAKPAPPTLPTVPGDDVLSVIKAGKPKTQDPEYRGLARIPRGLL